MVCTVLPLPPNSPAALQLAPIVPRTPGLDVAVLRMDELSGCWREAQRCDKAITLLSVIRELNLEFWDAITGVVREIETTSRLLRDLYDLFPLYKPRVPVVIYYLTVVLPCLCKTLRDMMIVVDNDDLPSHKKWTLMLDRMGDQGGMDLASRFVMYTLDNAHKIFLQFIDDIPRYIEFLVQCIRLLSKSPFYDPLSLEHLRVRILKLRLLRNIPAPPVAIQPHLAPVQPSLEEIERRHWAEKIFDDQPCPTTALRHRRDSKCFGPPMVDDRLGLAPNSKVLFKLPFNSNHLSITVYLLPDGGVRLLCRWMDKYYNPIYSCYGVHELCIMRRGSALQFRRWSDLQLAATVWAALFFKSWERMVLFHSSFVALKARCPHTVTVNYDDYRLHGEKKLFQAKIIDDGFQHSLAVIQDTKSGGVRLHAAVSEGELKRCPVWTAFITYQSDSPGWLYRRDRHRIWLRDLQPYVFCSKYKKRHQVQRKGEFELYFVERRGADAFEDLFRSESSTDSEDFVVEVPPP